MQGSRPRQGSTTTRWRWICRGTRRCGRPSCGTSAAGSRQVGGRRGTQGGPRLCDPHAVVPIHSAPAD
eukprot:2671923-Lingulodinium_polyedra.AAC.1